MLLHVTAISTPPWIVVRKPSCSSNSCLAAKRGFLSLLIFFFFFFSYSRVSERRRVAEKDSPSPPFISLLLGWQRKRGEGRAKRKKGKKTLERVDRVGKEKEEGEKKERRAKKIRIFDETEEESSYVSLSDCQASTLMRRGVISETVYWLDPSREGGSLSTSSRSLIPPPPVRHSTHPQPVSRFLTGSEEGAAARWHLVEIHDFSSVLLREEKIAWLNLVL